MTTNTVSGIYDNRKDLFGVLPITSDKIVMLGDSMTELGEWQELLHNTNIINRGISGDVCENLQNRLKDVTKFQPKKIFLMIGVNNLLFHTPREIEPEYEKVIQIIREQCPHTRLYLQSVLPTNKQVRRILQDNRDIDQLNHLIAQLAKRYQLPYINLYPHFQDANGLLKVEYTADGIHLNGKGYWQWAQLIKPYMED